jgi:hypothetical protein
MYELLRSRSLRTIATDAVPPLGLALLFAELFYKWHSFTLECIGFLATWFVFDWAWSKLFRRSAGAAD